MYSIFTLSEYIFTFNALFYWGTVMNYTLQAVQKILIVYCLILIVYCLMLKSLLVRVGLQNVPHHNWLWYKAFPLQWRIHWDWLKHTEKHLRNGRLNVRTLPAQRVLASCFRHKSCLFVVINHTSCHICLDTINYTSYLLTFVFTFQDRIDIIDHKLLLVT